MHRCIVCRTPVRLQPIELEPLGLKGQFVLFRLGRLMDCVLNRGHELIQFLALRNFAPFPGRTARAGSLSSSSPDDSASLAGPSMAIRRMISPELSVPACLAAFACWLVFWTLTKSSIREDIFSRSCSCSVKSSTAPDFRMESISSALNVFSRSLKRILIAVPFFPLINEESCDSRSAMLVQAAIVFPWAACQGLIWLTVRSIATSSQQAISYDRDISETVNPVRILDR